MTKYTTLDDFLTEEGIKAEVEASAAARVAEMEAAELDHEAFNAAYDAYLLARERLSTRIFGGRAFGKTSQPIAAAIVAYNAHMRAKALSEIAAADAPLLDGEPG